MRHVIVSPRKYLVTYTLYRLTECWVKHDAQQTKANADCADTLNLTLS